MSRNWRTPAAASSSTVLIRKRRSILATSGSAGIAFSTFSAASRSALKLSLPADPVVPHACRVRNARVEAGDTADRGHGLRRVLCHDKLLPGHVPGAAY